MNNTLTKQQRIDCATSQVESDIGALMNKAITLQASMEHMRGLGVTKGWYENVALHANILHKAILGNEGYAAFTIKCEDKVWQRDNRTSAIGLARNIYSQMLSPVVVLLTETGWVEYVVNERED